MDYSQIYIRARSAAWETLIRNNVKRLPIHIRPLARSYGIQCMTYAAGDKIIEALGLKEHSKKTDGFTVCVGKRKLIFYNEKRDRARRRWVIAHELGHHLLRHPMVKGDDGYYTLLNEEPSYYITENEQEANAYAAEALAPFIVLFCCDVFETGNISELCDISVTSAEFRRVSLFSAMNNGVSAATELELMVLQQFAEYIDGI